MGALHAFGKSWEDTLKEDSQRVEHDLEEMVKAERSQQLPSQSGTLMNLEISHGWVQCGKWRSFHHRCELDTIREMSSDEKWGDLGNKGWFAIWHLLQVDIKGSYYKK